MVVVVCMCECELYGGRLDLYITNSLPTYTAVQRVDKSFAIHIRQVIHWEIEAYMATVCNTGLKLRCT